MAVDLDYLTPYQYTRCMVGYTPDAVSVTQPVGLCNKLGLHVMLPVYKYVVNVASDRKIRLKKSTTYTGLNACTVVTTIAVLL